jgi:homoserine acetyltransferase
MAYAPGYDDSGVEKFDIPSFTFHDGTTIPIRVAYRSFNPSASKTVLVPTCMGGLINNTANFTNGALSSYRVIVVAQLSNGESSSPSNTEGFPKRVDYRDSVNSQHQLLTTHLGIKELEAIVGYSMAGQQAYYWAVMYPTFVKNVVCICGSAKTSPHNQAFIEGPKAALLNSVDYADGAYKTKGVVPKRGLAAFGRAYCAWAMSAAWFRERLFEKQGCKDIEELMEKIWDVILSGCDAEDLLGMARMWQAGDVGALRGDGSYEKALESIQARVLVMPSRTDQYFV